MARSFLDAQHEAAHVVVGLAVGLRFSSARLFPEKRAQVWGETVFDGLANDPRVAIMYAAGIAWEEGIGDPQVAAGDRALLAKEHYTRAEIRGLVRAAAAILSTLGREHARVTRLLVERDLTRADSMRLVYDGSRDDE
jgi:hypothetical protein